MMTTTRTRAQSKHWRGLCHGCRAFGHVLPTTSLLIMFLTGCNATMTQIKVPVPVVCQEAIPDRPAMDTESLEPSAPVDVQARAMRAEIDTREAYEIKLRAGLVNCTRPLAPP